MSKKKCSIYDLAFDYIKIFYKEDIGFEDKKQVIIDIVTLIDSGWTSDELYEHFKQFSYRNPNTILDLQRYFAGIPQKRFNLLSPTHFYMHNELRITTPPPIVHCDYNTGEFTKTVDPYFLEMRASYSIEDLYDYFLRKECLYESDTLYSNRMLGALKWLANNHDMDMLLFMIDTANDVIHTGDRCKLKNPMDIKDYYSEAKTLWQRKLTECKSAGDDKIVPKKRVLFG